MPKALCFDMDGTIADLYGVSGWLEKLRAEDPTPYRDAAPMWDMDALRQILETLQAQGWKICVISWLSKDGSREYNKATRAAKREWLTRYRFPADEIHLVSYGATKANSVRQIADPGILIDDNAKVRRGWHLGGTIDPTAVNLLEALAALAE